MFHTFIFEPIFNLLTAIYAIIPGHNFGLAIILFTIVVRLLMWPLVKKQLHHAKAMKAMQPEIKAIKKRTKGNRQQESMLVMALYKEKQINPLAPLGILLVQLPILLALYAGLRKIIDNPQAVIDNSYGFIKNLPAMKDLAGDIGQFDLTLFGFLDLTRSAVGKSFYLPAFMVAAASAVMQYYQTKQLSLNDKSSKTIRQIIRESASGKEVDQSEMSAAINRNGRFLFPALLFVITIGIASGLSLYILVSGIAAYIQQAIVLRRDSDELMSTVDAADSEKPKVVKSKVKTKKPVKKSGGKK